MSKLARLLLVLALFSLLVVVTVLMVRLDEANQQNADLQRVVQAYVEAEVERGAPAHTLTVCDDGGVEVSAPTSFTAAHCRYYPILSSAVDFDG
ncbi:MAG: hypothetical protein AAB865_01265 [Patescibacteria group bacterium]